jgi:hypothetical protein
MSKERVVQYNMVLGISPSELNSEVNISISEGFQPWGSPFITQGSTLQFHQAMVRTLPR